MIEAGVAHADPVVLRAVLYQLLGDEDVASMSAFWAGSGLRGPQLMLDEADTAALREKTVSFLKEYRDAGAGEIGFGAPERIPRSLALVTGRDLSDDELALCIEETGIDPWARSLDPPPTPSQESVEHFRVVVIGAGLGGATAAVHLKRAGIPFTVVEKRSGVGGVWWANRYPGVRVDTPSRGYTNIFGVDFEYPFGYCSGAENQRYVDWVVDSFDVRSNIRFNTEVTSMRWNEELASWELVTVGPLGERSLQANAVLIGIGPLSEPQVPDIPGRDEFAGPSWHTARWPSHIDLGKRFAVIGTGASGYQLIPELALDAEHVVVFQRRPQWLNQVPGYRTPLPTQVLWLERNVPLYANLNRARLCLGADALYKVAAIDPSFDDPAACNETNRLAREACLAGLERKLGDPELVRKMTPTHPYGSARPLVVDQDYNILDAIQRENVTLVTDGITRITPTGIETRDGTHHDVDVIVYATGFRVTEFFGPMSISGRDGRILAKHWKDEGPRGYRTAMVPGFPNLWMLAGPNSVGGLGPVQYHELVTRYALQCIERMIADDKRAIEVSEDAYVQYNALVDERNQQMVWSDPAASGYYSPSHETGANHVRRTSTMSPFRPREMFSFLRHPDFEDLELR
jgi:4-hydroxyacetophenone monooxygenase